MNNHCVSLKIAKKLKKAGWNKETEFLWVIFIGNYLGAHEWKLVSSREYSNLIVEVTSAPLATELLEVLPEHTYCFKFWRDNDWCWAVADKETINSNIGKGHTECGVTLPNALAKMWIYLKSKKLI